MKRIALVICVLTMSYPVGADALVGISMGAKVGMAEYGGEVLPGSGDVGGGTQWGLIFGIGALPVVDLEFRANYFSKEFNYTYDAMGTPIATSFKFEDASGIALLKANVFSPPGAPFGFYVGGGMGVHWLNTELATALAQGITPPSGVSSLAPFLETTAKPSGVGLVGLRLSAPAFPLSVFGEASYEMIFATERVDVTQVSAGLLLQF